MSRIKLDVPCNTGLLVLMDNVTLEAREMWKAPYASVCECLARPGSSLACVGVSVANLRRIRAPIFTRPFTEIC